jgi:hypothetical protein
LHLADGVYDDLAACARDLRSFDNLRAPGRGNVPLDR